MPETKWGKVAYFSLAGILLISTIAEHLFNPRFEIITPLLAGVGAVSLAYQLVDYFEISWKIKQLDRQIAAKSKEVQRLINELPPGTIPNKEDLLAAMNNFNNKTKH